jgi:uncharacterized membrane protein
MYTVTAGVTRYDFRPTPWEQNVFASSAMSSSFRVICLPGVFLKTFPCNFDIAESGWNGNHCVVGRWVLTGAHQATDERVTSNDRTLEETGGTITATS